MNLKDFTFIVAVFFTGIVFDILTWHFRFSQEIMRKELIMHMQEGNGYFLIFFLLGLLFLIILWGAYLVLFKIKGAYFKPSKSGRKE